MIKRGGIKDAELIEMIKQGKQEMNRAIECILFQQLAKVEGYLMKQNCGKEEAEDIFYEGLSIFILNARSGKFHGESSIGTYLIAICKRIWFKRFKKMMLHKKWEERERITEENLQEETFITKELAEGLEILMDNLKDKCKKVLQLWSLSYSMEEIRDQIGYNSTQAVINKKNLCLKELRKQLMDNPKLADLII